jgi:ribonuclease HI
VSERVIKVYTDGASRGNPGHAGIGIAFFDDDGEMINSYREYIGKSTNNFAEYTAIIKSLEILSGNRENFDKVKFYADSELLVNQLTGKYIIRNEALKGLAAKFFIDVKSLGKPFEISHVRREKNKVADKLANEAIDSEVKKAVQ